MEGWESVALSEVSHFRGGGTPSKKETEYWGGEIPWVSPKDMKSREIGSSLDQITERALAESSASLLPEGSVLVVVRSGILARTVPTAITSRELTVNQDLKAICPSDQLNPWFLEYFLQSSMPFLLKGVSRGATVHRLGTDFLKNLKIPLPSLPEQERIVAILNEAFAAIETATAHTEKNLANARKLFESQLQALLNPGEVVMEGWEEKTLAEACSITSSQVDPTEAAHIDLPHIGAGNVVSGSGEIVNVQTAKDEGLKSGKYLFDESMVLYSKIRPYLRKVCRPAFSGLCSADVYPLAPSEDNSRDFLYYVLLSEGFTEYAISGSARAGMPKVNRTHLFAYQRMFPPLPEQERIVAILDEVSEKSQQLCDSYNLKLEHLSNLKQSLLQKAFTGELTSDKKAADRTLSEAGL